MNVSGQERRAQLDWSCWIYCSWTVECLADLSHILTTL